MPIQHFLTLLDLSTQTLTRIIERSIELKQQLRSGEIHQPLTNKVITMLFDKSSTRTRVAFEAGIAQLGGHAIFLSNNSSQLGRGEPIADTAKVLSSMTDAIVIRTFKHSDVETLAEHASVPVINALTDRYHPCQLLADIQTYIEVRGNIEGINVAWVGDSNNMCHSYINAATQFGFKLNIACPNAYSAEIKEMAKTKPHIRVFDNPREAVTDAQLVTTDVWASMGQEAETAERKQAFLPFQVNAKLMQYADKNAVFMHCLPAHRGEEVLSEVIDGPQSVVWQQAENRLHTQKALLEYLIL